MLYTGKGDDGKTKTFGCNQKISKSSEITEALGSLDEINSFLGIVKVRAQDSRFMIQDLRIGQVVENIQQNLFIIQAELAGSDMKIKEDKLRECEDLINIIEKELPPIKTFFVSGGTQLSALFDFARTLARRAERRVVGVVDSGQTLGEWTEPYLNRLSSLLYALARISNHISGITEETPNYK
jgi:ATP:cob(I)alamin adenosyltransferase